MRSRAGSSLARTAVSKRLSRDAGYCTKQSVFWLTLTQGSDARRASRSASNSAERALVYRNCSVFDGVTMASGISQSLGSAGSAGLL